MPKVEENPLERFDPSTEKGRSAIRAAAEAEIKIWESDKVGFDPDDLGLIDLVRFALIVAEFYDHPKIKAARERDRFPLADIHRLVTFPEEWQVRWEDWQASAFAPEELLFAFVAQVDCHLHSPNLGRLGCAITDCPGLFASHWDTKVARQAILRADAVLYLITGDKQLAQNGLKSIRSLGLGKGLIFVGANCQTQTWKNAGKILEANKTLLQNQGLDIQPQNIRVYHALLALHATQLERGVDNLETSTLEELRRDFQLEHPDLARIKTKLERRITQFRDNLDPDDDGDGPSFGRSGMPELITAVESFVIERKAGAILLGNGKRVKDALSETEASLKLTEDNAQKRLEDSRSEFDVAKTALDKFERAIKDKLEELGEDAPHDLSESFWNQLESNRDQYIEESTKKISKHVRRIAWTFIKDKKGVIQRLENAARKEFETWISNQTELWLNGITEGNNQSYNRSIKRPLRQFQDTLKHLWEDVDGQQLPALDGIALPVIAAASPDAKVKLPEEFIDAITQLLNEQRNATFVISAVVITIVTIVIILVIVPLLAVPGMAILLTPLLAFLYPGFREWITPNGAPTLKKRFGEEFKKLEGPIKSKVGKEVHALVLMLRMHLDDEVVRHPRRVYNKRESDAESQFQLAEADRIKAAQEAKQAREQHVAPLRRRCESYLAEVRPLFPKHD